MGLVHFSSSFTVYAITLKDDNPMSQKYEVSSLKR